jgi:hypothetical protein
VRLVILVDRTADESQWMAGLRNALYTTVQLPTTEAKKVRSRSAHLATAVALCLAFEYGR